MVARRKFDLTVALVYGYLNTLVCDGFIRFARDRARAISRHSNRLSYGNHMAHRRVARERIKLGVPFFQAGETPLVTGTSLEMNEQGAGSSQRPLYLSPPPQGAFSWASPFRRHMFANSKGQGGLWSGEWLGKQVRLKLWLRRN